MLGAVQTIDMNKLVKDLAQGYPEQICFVQEKEPNLTVLCLLDNIRQFVVLTCLEKSSQETWSNKSFSSSLTQQVSKDGFVCMVVLLGLSFSWPDLWVGISIPAGNISPKYRQSKSQKSRAVVSI